jgi:dTDP-6-deoxy-L-hexose 3-O-methyltransferase
MDIKKVYGFEYKKTWDYENGFYLTSPSSRLAKAITHWEIYKKIVGLPGDVLEFGVYKGTSLIRFATYREMLESQYSRKIIGFDTFGQFPLTDLEEDNKFIKDFSKNGESISEKELREVFINKKFDNYEFYAGDILQTLPKYIEKNPELKISLLHIDVDVYKPTKAILNMLFEKVVKNGIIILDDYGTVYGETKAVDEFISSQINEYKLEKLPYYKIPVFIVK